MSTVFVTGGTGFIGSNLLRKIPTARYKKIFCLSRAAVAVSQSSNADTPQFVTGDICSVESYAPYLDGCDSVIHLAATTGKAPAADYFQVNSKGTELLVKQCERSGVRNFLYISTIAVKFPDKRRYPYARSKELGEQAVKSSSLNYKIIRPTIVIGKEAGNWKSLSQLARKPVLLIFGDGATWIQPIYIEDLTDCILQCLYEKDFNNQTIEMGGPEKITFERFLKRIHSLQYAKEPPVLHLPLKPLVSILSFVEDYVSSRLPISAGQFSAFANDGTIEWNQTFSKSAHRMKGINEMLNEVIDHE